MNDLIKRIVLASTLLIVTTSLVSCDKNDSSNRSSDTENVTEVFVDYPYYQDLNKLSSAATGIFTGKIIGKELLYINDITGETANDKNGINNSDDYFLYTVYEIQSLSCRP